MQIKQEKGHYTLYKESEAIGTAVVDGAAILRLEIVPAWRGRGYGSYLVKELLRRGGGQLREKANHHEHRVGQAIQPWSEGRTCYVLMEGIVGAPYDQKG